MPSPRGWHGTCQRHMLAMSSWQIYLHVPASQVSPAETSLAAPTVWSALQAFLHPRLPRHQQAHSVQTGQSLVHILIPSAQLGTWHRADVGE